MNNEKAKKLAIDFLIYVLHGSTSSGSGFDSPAPEYIFFTIVIGCSWA